MDLVLSLVARISKDPSELKPRVMFLGGGKECSRPTCCEMAEFPCKKRNPTESGQAISARTRHMAERRLRRTGHSHEGQCGHKRRSQDWEKQSVDDFGRESRTLSEVVRMLSIDKPGKGSSPSDACCRRGLADVGHVHVAAWFGLIAHIARAARFISRWTHGQEEKARRATWNPSR